MFEVSFVFSFLTLKIHFVEIIGKFPMLKITLMEYFS